jgi:hypothetical protein
LQLSFRNSVGCLLTLELTCSELPDPIVGSGGRTEKPHLPIERGMSKLLTISEAETLHGLPSVIMAGFTCEDVSVVMLDRELLSKYFEPYTHEWVETSPS